MAQELQQLRPGDSFAGRYRVVRLIRAGGMGAVYEVEDTSTRRRRALKLMHPTLVQSADSRMRFEREKFIGAELDTEHIVEVLDGGVDQGSQTPFIVMELLKGEELGDRLERVRRMNAQEVVEIMGQVARALDKAHAHGIVHRDLKPENIYLPQREDGLVRAKILDFGIAKLVEGAQTSATQAAGTPLYMAPEQTDKMGHVSPVTDVWALGLVIYRMLVGSSYWQGDSLQQLYRQILMDPITSPVERAAAVGVGLPPGFDMWFGRCVARNPQERWPAAGQAVAELARVFNLSISRPLNSTPNPDTMAMTAAAGAPGTLDPVANVTPAPVYAQPQGGMGYAGTAIANVTPYPSPNVTPYPNPNITPATQQPMHTPMPGPAMSPPPGTMPLGYGTQVAAPGMWQQPGASGAGAIPPTPAMQAPRKSGGNGALIGALVAVVLLGGGVGAYFAFAGPSSGSGGTQPTGKPTEPTKKPKPVADDDDVPKKDNWLEKVAKLNSFLPVPMKDMQLQKHEVTREEYANYVANDKKARKPVENFETLAPGAKDGNIPVTWVTYEMAEGYCKAIGARLPTVEEWDAAVAGPDKRKFPWGNEWPKTGTGDFRDLAVGRGEHATPVEVGSSPFDKGAYGHLDLAGNAQEWTSTDFQTKYKKVRGTDVGGDEKEFKDPGEVFTEANAPMGAANAAKAGEHLGFRCAKDGK